MDDVTHLDHAGRAASVQHPHDVIVNPVRLAVFCAVVEQRSFTRAAHQLALSQPTVSAHVRALEDAFGAALFDRRRRGAWLTEAGQVVYDFALSQRRELTAVHTQLHDLASGHGGATTVGASMFPGTYILPTLLVAFCRRHADARVRLRVLPADEVIDAVLDARLDFGIISVNVQARLPLRLEPLWTERLVVVAARSHPLARLRRVTAADVAGEAFVAGPARRGGEELLARAGISARTVLELGTQEGVKQAVLAGLGLGLLFERVAATELEAGELVALPVEELTRILQVKLAYRRASRFSPLAQTLVRFIRDHARHAQATPAILESVQELTAARIRKSPAVPPSFSDGAAVRDGLVALTDAQWDRVAPQLMLAYRRGRPRADARRTLEGVLWVILHGAPWAAVPPGYGAASTCHQYLQRWRAQGTWPRIWDALLAPIDPRIAQQWRDAYARWEASSSPTRRTAAAARVL